MVNKLMALFVDLKIQERWLCPSSKWMMSIRTLGMIQRMMGTQCLSRMMSSDHWRHYKRTHSHPHLGHESSSRTAQGIAVWYSWGRYWDIGARMGRRTGGRTAVKVGCTRVGKPWNCVGDDGVSSTEAGSAPFSLTWGAGSIRILVGGTHVIHQGLSVQTYFMTHRTWLRVGPPDQSGMLLKGET